MKARGKYGAVPTMVDGIRFASKAEAHRYQELRLLAAAGAIRGLKLQPRYKLYAAPQVEPDWAVDASIAVCDYIADFEYEESIPGSRCGVRTVTEDSKSGVKTAVYRLKKKFFEACYGRTIRETS